MVATCLASAEGFEASLLERSACQRFKALEKMAGIILVQVRNSFFQETCPFKLENSLLRDGVEDRPLILF